MTFTKVVGTNNSLLIDASTDESDPTSIHSTHARRFLMSIHLTDGSPEVRALNRLDNLQAITEFDTLSEVAAELQELRNQIAALRGGRNFFLLLE